MNDYRLFSLPIRMGGLGIVNIVKDSDASYTIRKSLLLLWGALHRHSAATTKMQLMK